MENDSKTVKRIHDKKNRIQKVQELHQRKDKERADAISLIKTSYLIEQQNPVILDILAKAKSFAEYHMRIAKDGVGYKIIEKGEEPEIYHLTSEKRVSELDKAAGISELLDYIERQFKESPKQKDDSAVDVEPEEPADDSLVD